MSKNIIVIGSCNTDMVIKADRLPVPGETIIGGSFMMNPGGKGANQAVAAARLKGNVHFIAKTGNDLFGKRSIEQYEDEGIHFDFISTVDVCGASKSTVTVLRQNRYSGKTFPGIIVYSACDADLCVQIERAHVKTEYYYLNRSHVLKF